MPRGAAIGIAGAKAYHKATEDGEQESAQGEQLPKAEHIGWQQAAEILHALLPQQLSGMRVDVHRPGPRQEVCGDEAAGYYPGHKKEVPAFVFPVVFKKGDAGRQAGGANMPQRRGDAKWFVAEDEQGRHHEADKRSGDVPGPGAGEQFHRVKIGKLRDWGVQVFVVITSPP